MSALSPMPSGLFKVTLPRARSSPIDFAPALSTEILPSIFFPSAIVATASVSPLLVPGRRLTLVLTPGVSARMEDALSIAFKSTKAFLGCWCSMVFCTKLVLLSCPVGSSTNAPEKRASAIWINTLPSVRSWLGISANAK